MARQVVSRTQRRVEKKHALMILALLLVGGLVSFSLGVMVGGKDGSPDDVVEEQIVQQKPVSAAPLETGPAGAVPSEEEPIEEELTFYETLPQGQDNALGSGINLPPEKEKTGEQVSAPPVKKPAVPGEVGPIASRPPVAKPVAQKPASSTSGDFLVQVASVKDRHGAVELRDRMAARGYAAFVEQTDLGEKGVWHRVYAGPFGSKEDADKTIAALKADQFSSAPLLKKR
jgi:cell division septation protein DedD